MNWVEAVIETLSHDEGLATEILTGLLMEHGINGVQTDDPYEMRMFLENNADYWDYADEELLKSEKGKAYVKFYVEEKYSIETIADIKNSLKALKEGEFSEILGSLELTCLTVDDEGWLDNWKKYYKPFRIGKNVVVKPLWESYDKLREDVVLNLNPGQVFGTGLHQTTQMCIEALEKLVKPGMSFLDAGCGSGILSVAGLLMSEGSRAAAIDIDKAAAGIVMENAGNNFIEADRIKVRIGNILKDEGLLERVSKEKYDLIFANIVADIVIDMTPILSKLLADKGRIVASGIIKSRLDDVLSCAKANGLKIYDVITKDEWVCAVMGL